MVSYIIIHHIAEFNLKTEDFAIISLNFHFGFTVLTPVFSVSSAFIGIIKT